MRGGFAPRAVRDGYPDARFCRYGAPGAYPELPLGRSWGSMAVPATMLFDYVDRVFIGVHAATSPSVDDWRQHCEHLASVREELRGVLVYTDGGAPNSRQREDLRVALQGDSPPIAVLNSSRLIRGVITSMNWFYRGEPVIAFAPSNIAAALDHIEQGGTPLDRGAIVRTLVATARTLGVSMPPVGALGSRRSSPSTASRS